MDYRYLAIEGPVGAGKTALAERLALRLDATAILEDADNPFLADFYQDKPGSAFQAQLFFLLNRHRQLGSFREDLYFRLNVIPIQVSPLRERREDVGLLARHFIEQIGADYGKRPKQISAQALEALTAHCWPGNVRELRNVIERLVIMTPGDRIEASDLPGSMLAGERSPASKASVDNGLVGEFPSLIVRPGRPSRSATSGRSTSAASAT